MYDAEIKREYAAYNQKIQDARSRMDLTPVDKRSADDTKAINNLLDAAQAHRDEAGRYERLDLAEKDLDKPLAGKRLPTNGGDEEKPESKDRAQMLAFRRGLLEGPKALSTAERAALLEGKTINGLIASDNTLGGYLLAPQMFVTDLLKAIDDMVFVRSLSTIYQVRQAASLGIPTIATNPNDADWTSEITTVGQDNALTFGKRELHPHLLTKEIDISSVLLMLARLDPEAIVRDRMAYKFAITMEKGYLTGTGANQPLGVFIASASGISMGRDVATAGSTSIVGDDLIKVRGALKPQYLNNATWVFNRSVITLLMQLKGSTNDHYIWIPSLQTGQPDMLLGRPVVSSEYAPSTVTAGLYTGLLGDFKAGYVVADAMELTIQVLTEIAARTNQNAYIGRAFSDGMPYLEEAFARMQQKP